MLTAGYVTSVLLDLVDPRGRMGRGTYWYRILLGGLGGAIANVWDHALLEIGGDSIGPLTAAFIAVVVWPLLAMTVRRLRDVGVAAAWVGLVMVPVAGWLVLLHWTTLPAQVEGSGAVGEQEWAAGLPVAAA